MHIIRRSTVTGAGLWIYTGKAQFVEFFPDIDEQAAAAVGREEDGGYFTGEQLDHRLGQIGDFLEEHFPKADEDDA